MAFIQNLQQQIGAETQLQSLPPAVQKAIFLHLTQQQQQQQESQAQGNDPQKAEGQDDNGTSRGEERSSFTVLRSHKTQNHNRHAALGGKNTCITLENDLLL